MKPLAEKLAERKEERLKKLATPRTKPRKVGRPKARKNNMTLVNEAAKEVMSELYASEIEKIQEHADEVVKRVIYRNIRPIVEKMAQQAIEGKFPQQKEFLKRVSPETKAIDHGHATQTFNVQINVSEFKR